MEHQEETFNISVQINPGLEPLTMSISIVTEEPALTNHTRAFKVTRDQESLGVLRQNADHSWERVEGNMDQEQVDVIGATIAAHYNPNLSHQF